MIIIILYQILLKWEKDIVIINYYYNSDWFILIYEIFELLSILAIVGNYLYFKYINLKYIIPKQEIKQESNNDNNETTQVIIQNHENEEENDEEITYYDILVFLKEPEILPFLRTFTFGFLGLF